MWPFTKMVKPQLPRYTIKVNGYGQYVVSAGAGYAWDTDDLAWMRVSMWFNDKKYASIQQAENAIAEFEKHLVNLETRVAKEIF